LFTVVTNSHAYSQLRKPLDFEKDGNSSPKESTIILNKISLATIGGVLNLHDWRMIGTFNKDKIKRGKGAITLNAFSWITTSNPCN